MISLKRLVSSVCARPGGQRQQRLAGARRAEDGHEVDVRVEQQVQREVLLAVARGDAPDGVALAAVVLRHLERRGLAVDLAHDRLEAVVPGVVQELVRVPLVHQRSAHAVVGAGLLVPGLDVVAVRLPEIRRQRGHAGEQQVGVLDRAVVVVILRVDAEDRRLDAQVDVLGHERDARAGQLDLQRERIAEQGVVDAVAVAGERVGKSGGKPPGLEVEPARRRLLAVVPRAPGRQLEPLVDLCLGGVRHQLVEEPADLAHVPRRFREAFLARVELLEHAHRQVDVVFLEAEHGRRVVHQDVGVEHECAARALDRPVLHHRVRAPAPRRALPRRAP